MTLFSQCFVKRAEALDAFFMVALDKILFREDLESALMFRAG